mgnify:CR=1 FL=1|nr:ABC transporter ATP-binding protein [uncultured Tyzzerella sp.]
MIKINNVSAYYNKFKALNNISFNIEYGQNLSIIGPNGCGKTTLLKCISNNINFEGNIYINDENIKSLKRKQLAKKIGMLSQLMSISFNYSIFDTVMMGRYVHQNRFLINNDKKDIDIVLDALKIVDLLDIKDKYISNLSGGQLQRVFLARLIAQDPDIILLDEPTNHLDFKYQIELIKFLKQWGENNNKTIIGVIHDINLSMLLTDNILILQNGNMKCLDKSQNILKSNILNEIYNINIKDYMLETLKKWEI